MLQILEHIKLEAESLKTTVDNGFELVVDDFNKVLAKIEEAIGVHKAQPAESAAPASPAEQAQG